MVRTDHEGNSFAKGCSEHRGKMGKGGQTVKQEPRSEDEPEASATVGLTNNEPEASATVGLTNNEPEASATVGLTNNEPEASATVGQDWNPVPQGPANPVRDMKGGASDARVGAKRKRVPDRYRLRTR